VACACPQVRQIEGSGAELFAALGTTARKNAPSTDGFHPGTKTVPALAY
jgi:hypothetical protein